MQYNIMAFLAFLANKRYGPLVAAIMIMCIMSPFIVLYSWLWTNVHWSAAFGSAILIGTLYKLISRRWTKDIEEMLINVAFMQPVLRNTPDNKPV